jgi:tetratricopeptide (TPR) repeat protein
MNVAHLKKRANEAIGKSDLQLALSVLSEALALAPDDRALWANRSYVHELRKAPIDALADARRAIELDPGFPKGFLRASRALVALGRPDEAYDLVAGVIEEFPQDYALAEALAAADEARKRSGPAELGRGGAGGAGGSAVAESEAALVEASAAAAALRDRKPAGSGFGSSYYYAAVPSAKHTLPVVFPSRIEAPAAPGPCAESGLAWGAAELAATGGVRADIERRGEDSYYYAHARGKDYYVPTVPKRIDADGSLKPWQPPGGRA